MWTNPIIINILLITIGLGSGASIAAGIFALISKIDVIPQIDNRTKTTHYVRTYEMTILAGGVTGTILTIFDFSFAFPIIFITFGGLCYGIFLGCLATALAESLNVTSIFTRRLKLHKGIPWIVLSMALGKTLGSLIYYIHFYFPKK